MLRRTPLESILPLKRQKHDHPAPGPTSSTSYGRGFSEPLGRLLCGRVQQLSSAHALYRDPTGRKR